MLQTFVARNFSLNTTTMSSTITLPTGRCDEWSYYYIGSLEWSPDGTRIACTSDKLRVYDVASHRCVCEIDTRASPAAWTRSGKFLITENLCIYDAASGKLVQKGNLDFSVRTIAVSKEMKVAIAKSSNENAVYIWDTRINTLTKHRLGRAELVSDGDVADLNWSPSGTQLAIAQGLNALIYDVKTQQVVKTFQHPNTCSITFLNHVQFVRWSPGGKYLATTTLDGAGEVRVWDIATGRVVLTYVYSGPSAPGYPNFQPGYVLDLAWSPDSKHMAIATNDGVRVWSLGTNQVVRAIRANTLEMTTHRNVAWSPDGQRIAYSEDTNEGKRLIHICADPFDFNILTNLYSSVKKFVL